MPITFPSIPFLALFGGAAICCLQSSCAPSGHGWFFGGEAAAANDQIMLVREEPPSFGFQRLRSQTLVYPDLGTFVSTRGMPNFLVETGSHERHYFILYYLRERQAFACRVRASGSQPAEFAGPSPITDREFRLLDGFRRNPDQKKVRF